MNSPVPIPKLTRPGATEFKVPSWLTTVAAGRIPAAVIALPTWTEPVARAASAIPRNASAKPIVGASPNQIVEKPCRSRIWLSRSVSRGSP